MPVEAVLDAYPDWRIPAHVIATIPSADRQKATVKVRIGFEQLDPRILPDMGVKVSFLNRAAGVRRGGGASATDRAESGDSSGRRQVDRVRDARRSRRTARGQRRIDDWGFNGSALGSQRGRSCCRRRPANTEGRRQGQGAMMSNSLVTVRDLHKVFQRGGQRIDVLQGVNLDIPEGDFLALMGPSGSGKTTLLNLIGRTRYAERRIHYGRRRSHRQAVRGATLGVARPAYRVRLSVVQPAAGAHRGAERRASAAPDQTVEGGAAQARAGRACRWSVSPNGCTTIRASCRAARNSASASPARLSPTRRCCSATSRPATSIENRVTRFSICCRRSIATREKPSSW